MPLQENLPKGILSDEMSHPLNNAELDIVRVAMNENPRNAEKRDMSLFLGERQDRLEEALRLGALSDAPFHHVAVFGMQGSGCLSLIQKRVAALIEKGLRHAKAPPRDWCYLYNFEDPSRPAPFSMAAGGGRKLRAEIERVLSLLREEMPHVQNDGATLAQLLKLSGDFEEQCKKKDAELSAFAKERGYLVSGSLVTGDVRIARMSREPLEDGGEDIREMSDEEYGALGEEEKALLHEKEKNLLEALSAAARERNVCAGAARNAAEEVKRRAANEAILSAFAELTFADDGTLEPELARWMENLKKHAAESYEIFLKQDEEREGFGRLMRAGSETDPFLPWRVTVFVDNAAPCEEEKPRVPIIAEQITSVQDLAGRIGQIHSFASVHSDHTMLSSGVLARANGGFLVLSADDIVSVPGAWHFLKRSLKNGSVAFETSLTLSGLPETTLMPLPIPLRLRVILCGDRKTLSLLAKYDSEFADIFTVRAEVMPFVERDYGQIANYARWARWYAEDAGVLPPSEEAVAAILEHAGRMCDRRDFFATDFTRLAMVIEESAHEAGDRGASLVTGEHVRAALQKRVWRSGVITEMVQQNFKEKNHLISVSGCQVGSINALAVFSQGDSAFGIPMRVTSVVSAGIAGIVNIHRSAQMGGKIFAKADITVQGLLAHMFARDVPLALRIIFSFEQEYGRIDGDSASIAEYVVILSSIAGVPLAQSIAVTGSLSLVGDVQAVGGVNEKIEGFFDTCKTLGGLTGSQGVIIPWQNKNNLMLRHDVVRAAEEGKFHVWAIRSLEEAVSLLTGMNPAEFYEKVREQLKKFSEDAEEKNEASSEAGGSGKE
ncbi:MAG: AAA family ATPase [Parcubacteria group bacterium]|nr:AAA family ATPase [Parcubacteria group bacterium]